MKTLSLTYKSHGPAHSPLRATLLIVALICGLTSARAAYLNGSVQSGGTSTAIPIAKVKVTLYEARKDNPKALASVTTDLSGHFLIHVPQASTDGIFFVKADLGDGVELIAILGPTLPSTATLNELTTVAAAYSMAQFYRSGAIKGDPFALRIAASMNDNLVAVETGISSAVLTNSPNGNESDSLQSTRALANLLSACTLDHAVARQLLKLTQERGKPAPKTTPQALANLVRNPSLNVSSLYALANIWTPYLPSLTSAPDAWTVTVKVNDSGDDDYLIGGMGNITFDTNGYAWITDNVVQGTPFSSHVLVVLQPNGKPADGADGTPVSPITGGGLLGAGFGITIDPKGSVWVGNFGWGPLTTCDYYPSTNCSGSVSQFSPTGQPISGPNGYQGGPDRVQGMAADKAGNIWITSYGNDAVYVFLKGNPSNVASYQAYTGSQPFDVQIASDGTAWLSCGGGITGDYPSSLSHFKLSGTQLKLLAFVEFGKAIKGFSLDSHGNAWVASQNDNLIYEVSPNGKVIGSFGGGGISGPWSTTIDGDDNIWVANFGPLEIAPYTSRLSKLAGANPATRPQGLKMGDPISPATGYTVRSAGDQVLLHNGVPLYGVDSAPSFEPLQRMTATGIDAAGNLWCLNNWKYNFLIDITTNPGGDGVVIFVGLATPLKKN